MTDAALAAVAARARYIAVEAGAPDAAGRWLERVRDAMDSLAQWPRRAPKAEEDAYLEYEVRQLVVGNHLLLFTVDDDRRTVRVIGLRHGHRLPRPSDLPAEPGTREHEDDDD